MEDEKESAEISKPRMKADIAHHNDYEQCPLNWTKIKDLSLSSYNSLLRNGDIQFLAKKHAVASTHARESKIAEYVTNEWGMNVAPLTFEWANIR